MVYGAFLIRPNIQGPNGFATLLVIMVLLVGMTTISLTVSRSGILEQQLTGNDSRSQEIQKASDAALEYAIAWAINNPIPWVTNTVNCGADSGCPTLPSDLTGSDGGAFVLSVQFKRNPAPMLDYFQISATATQSDNQSAASSSCYVWRDSFIATPPFKIVRMPGTWKDF